MPAANRSGNVFAMIVVDVEEAQTHFFSLIEKVEQGEEVIITRDGEPVARLIRIESDERGSARAASGRNPR
jgi:prevent-host-death family protein